MLYFQQQDGSRISGLNKDGKLRETMYEDVHTLYEALQRGARVSSKYMGGWGGGGCFEMLLPTTGAERLA